MLKALFAIAVLAQAASMFGAGMLLAYDQPHPAGILASIGITLTLVGVAAAWGPTPRS